MCGQASKAAPKTQVSQRNRLTRPSKLNYKISNNYKNSLMKKFDYMIDVKRYITNLSSKVLTDTQESVLALGLKHIPCSKAQPQWYADALYRFKRSCRLWHRYKDAEETEPHPFKPRSGWNPPKASKEIEDYLERVEHGIDNLIPIKYTPNLSRAQYKALRDLASDTELVIKSADKGSGIVVEDRSNYIKDGLAHLSDESVYHQIDSDPTQKLAQALNQFANSLHRNGIIDSITRDYLKFPPNNDKIPRTQQTRRYIRAPQLSDLSVADAAVPRREYPNLWTTTCAHLCHRSNPILRTVGTL